MRVHGTFQFRAPPAAVYRALLDPVALQACIPGCERLESTGPRQYRATVKVGIAAIRGTFQGDVSISDEEPDRGYQMQVTAKGGPGTVAGGATIRLSPAGEETTVDVEGDARIAGPAAGVAQRLFGGIATSMMNQFFGCMQSRVSAADEAQPTR
jgi:carbon monoxide dehydrogenase subunit G